MGLIKADTGKAEMFGFDCWKESIEIRRRIGILYEKIAFYDGLSGFDQLKLMAKLKGISNPLIEIKNVLDLVGLNDAQNRKIAGYSAGMRQRLGLAQALLGQPELVILDEPTSNLDPIGRAKVLEIIDKLQKNQGISFLISSHILSELEKVCNSFILMNKGKVIRQGSLEQLLMKGDNKTFMIKVQPATGLLRFLESEEYVETLSMNGAYLQVTVKDVARFKQRLPLLISQAHASLEEVKVVRDDLESMFKLAIEEN